MEIVFELVKLSEIIKVLIYKEHPLLFEKLECKNDATFLEPLLFSYFNSKKENLFSNENLKKIINQKDFLKIWKLKKDNISVCKECEFRYICPDNRVPILNKRSNTYAHKTKCNYDPKTTKWN